MTATPGQRPRRRNRPGRPAPLVAGAAGAAWAAGLLLAGCASSAPSRPPVAMPTATPRAASGPELCTVPTYPTAGSASDPIPSSSLLAGPAVSSLTGGAARADFSLDDGAFSLSRPGPNDRPAVDENVAECTAIASLGPGAVAESGMAVGYGRVTIDPSRFAASTTTGVASGTSTTGTTRSSPVPTLPGGATYQDRLAWVVVVYHVVGVNCPLERVAPTTTTPNPNDHGYQIFVFDASTGDDALVYTEGQPDQCGFPGRMPPEVGAATEQVSVPWTLVSRDTNDYAATADITVLPCDRYDTVDLVDRDDPDLEITVTRPVGVSCGAPVTKAVTVHAATVTSDLPPVIEPAALGPVVTTAWTASPPPGAGTTTTTVPSAPPTTLGNLYQLRPGDDGRTIDVTVGTVVVVTMPGVSPNEPSPVTTSNPAVVDYLDGRTDGPVAELRAWSAGTANLTVAQADCAALGAGAPVCNGPWVVHLVVH